MNAETKEKIANSLQGHPVSDEARKKMSLAKKGKPLTESHRKKISESKQKNSPFEWHLVGPDGQEHVTSSLTRFCMERKLNQNTMWCLAVGRIGYYLGWDCKKVPKTQH